MKRYKYIRLSLILLLIITTFLFFLHIKNKSKEPILSKPLKEENLNAENNSEISNILEKIKYVSEDLRGNVYIIESVTGFVDQKNPNIILMETVVGTIKLSENRKIKITSDKAKFNNENYETSFFNNVKIKHDEHNAIADNLDLSFKDNYLIMQNNLIYKNSSITVKSDILEIDFYKKISKMYMKDKKKSIRANNIE